MAPAVSKFTLLRVLLGFSLVDSLSAWLLILLYLTGLDLIWIVNINFLLMFACMVLFVPRRLPLNFLTTLFLVAIGASALKMLLFLESVRTFDAYHLATYGYGLCMPLAALAFGSRFHPADLPRLERELRQYANYFLWIALPGIVVYSTLYFMGRIEYFGLGVNLYYIYPHLVASKTVGPTILFFAICFLTGKRASLLTLLVQVVFRHLAYWKGNVFGFAGAAALFFILMLGLYEFTELLDRFKWLFDGSIDFTDPRFLAVSAGGRFEELFGISAYFFQHPMDLLFGAPPGASYFWVLEWADYITTKNYSHVTWAGYLFRYGLIFALPLLVLFIWLLISNLGSTRPLFIVFVGILTVSFFGALLLTDPSAWLFVALFYQVTRPAGMVKTVNQTD